MKIFQIGLMLLLLSLTGCMSYHEAVRKSQNREDFESRDDFLHYVMEGYVEGTENLYLTSWKGGRIRLKKLHNALGLDQCDDLYTINRGQLLIFEKNQSSLEPNELGTLVLSADNPPKLIRSPEELWDGDCRVIYHSSKDGEKCFDKRLYQRISAASINSSLSEGEFLEFYNGHIFDIGRMAGEIDKDMKFLCYRKLEKDPESGTYTHNESYPMYIISVDNPEVQVQSRLKYFPDSMVTNNNRLYLTTVTHKKELPVFHIEIFDISGGKIKYVKDYYTNPPWAFGGPAVLNAFMWAYDHQTNSQIVDVNRRLPLRNHKYLYSYNDDSFKEIPFWGTTVFIDPDILRNSVQYVDLEKLRN